MGRADLQKPPLCLSSPWSARSTFPGDEGFFQVVELVSPVPRWMWFWQAFKAPILTPEEVPLGCAELRNQGGKGCFQPFPLFSLPLKMYLNSSQQGLELWTLPGFHSAAQLMVSPQIHADLAIKTELQGTYLLHYSASLYILTTLTLKARGTERSRGWRR